MLLQDTGDKSRRRIHGSRVLEGINVQQVFVDQVEKGGHVKNRDK